MTRPLKSFVSAKEDKCMKVSFVREEYGVECSMELVVFQLMLRAHEMQ